MHTLIAAICLSALLLGVPAAAQGDFGPPAPFQDTHPPSPPPASTVIAFDHGGGTVRIIRSFSDGRPSLTADVPTTRHVGTVNVAHNPARDALAFWTETDAAEPGKTYAKTVFWPAGADAPGAAREFLISDHSGAAGDTSASLDPGRSATLVFQLGLDVWQATSPNVAAANPWSNGATLLTTYEPRLGGESIDWTHAVDGRAIYAFKQRVSASGPTPAYFKLLVSTRVPGHPFSTPVQIDGGPPPGRTLDAGPALTGLAPHGRAMVAYTTTTIYTSRACPFTETDGERRHVQVALGPVSASAPAFSINRVSAPDYTAGTAVERPIVGQDDRLAVGWHEAAGHFCDGYQPQRLNFAYTVPGQGTTTTGPPPEVFSQYWFQCDGQLYFKFTPPGGSPMGTVFDTGVPGTCDAAPKDTDGDGLADSSDACPNVSDVGKHRTPRNGCPAPPAAPKPTAGDDTLSGTAAANTICGLAGNDTLFGLGGNDTLFGDACNDKAKRALGAAAAVDGADTLDGGDGDDVLYGAGGNDTLKGGKGKDKLFGGAGNDKLNGGPDNDKLNGGGGKDTLTGGPGKNSYKGGGGNDSVNARNRKKETVDCGGGKKDKATVDKADKVKGCEKVKRRK
jgi:hypothetical protein